MTAGNDVVDLSNWKGSDSVNIGDAFSNDNDKVAVMASSLAGTNSNLKLTSIENLEIINAKETKALNLVGENFKGLESIKLKGDATTLNVSGFTYGVKIDATENADNIFGGTKADTINGGAGNDTIQGNQGNDVLTGGNGADTFIIGNAKDFGVDQILDFSAEDKISMDGFSVNELKKFDASTFSTVTYKTLDSVLATFAAGGANVTKPNDVVIFSYDGKTYALLSTGAGFKEANDALVDITGANVASLTESNFGAFTSQYNYASVAAFNEAADQGLIPVNTATITVGSGDEALKTTDIQYIKDGGILSIASGATVSIKLQGSGDKFDATSNDFVAKFASKVPALNITDTSGNDTITAGSGKDAISLGAGKDTVVFAATAADNGVDTITGFTAGATSGDVLNFKAFLDGKAAGKIAKGSGLLGTSGLDLSSSKVGVTEVAGGTIDSSNIDTASSNTVGIADNGKAVVLVVNTSSAGTAGAVNIYYVQDTDTGTSQNWDVQLVGTLNSKIEANSFVDSNFA